MPFRRRVCDCGPLHGSLGAGHGRAASTTGGRVTNRKVIEGMDETAPTTTNDQGGSQSMIPYRFDLFDGPSMFKMAEVLHTGAEKYGENNWRKIVVADHLNHLIAHAYAFLAGDESDDHLSHVMCRAMFAQGVEIAEATNERENHG